jgi:hypothetical protein
LASALPGLGRGLSGAGSAACVHARESCMRECVRERELMCGEVPAYSINTLNSHTHTIIYHTALHNRRLLSVPVGSIPRRTPRQQRLRRLDQGRIVHCELGHLLERTHTGVHRTTGVQNVHFTNIARIHLTNIARVPSQRSECSLFWWCSGMIVCSMLPYTVWPIFGGSSILQNRRSPNLSLSPCSAVW